MPATVGRYNSLAQTTDQMNLFHNNATVNRSWVGAFGEIIVLETPATESVRQKIEGYLAHKWGTTLNAGHPYETEAP